MKRTLSMIALAVLTVGLLGSCSKINERLDNLEKKVSGIENEQIASINSQIDGIKTSIADLGTIRSDISSLKQSASDHSVDIFNLEEADRALKDRIVNLEEYVDAVLPNYAEKEWVEATFSTLAQYEATCDTIAKIDARIGALDAKLSKDIKACADSLTKWVNKTFEGYYTAAEMDASLAQMKSDIDSAKAANKITDAKADSIAGELAKVKPEVDTVKANIRAEYKAAVKAAIEESEGKLTKELTDAISEVNGKIESLVTRVDNLATEVDELTGRVEKLEGMIQSVVIVPAYSDGSVDAKAGFVTVNIIVEPASAVAALDESCITVFVNTVKTKSVSLDTAEVVTLEKDTETGIVSILADVSDFTPESGNALAVAVNVKTGLSDYTTDFSPVTSTNVKVVVGGEGEPNQVLMTAMDPGAPKDVEGKIPVKGEDGKNTFDQSKSTVIKVVGIGTVTFDKDATKKIAENAADADSIFFEVKDVTPGGKQEVVYQVLMKKKTAEGGDVFSESNAAGEVTMEIPLASNVADVTKVTLLDGSDKPIDGGVVYGSVIYDSENKIVTFKVNHFSKYAVGYILDDENYHKVTGISLDKSALELEKGAFKKLIATIKPDNASNKNVIWSSSDTSKVKVDTAGKVTAVALGTATVTATSMNNRSLTATCEVTVVELKSYVEIAAKYNGSTTTNLRWYRQSLAITASGQKAWKGGSGSAVKIPGTDEDVVVGDYFQWGTFAGFYGSGADSDKGLLPYSSFTNTKCGDGSDNFTFKSGKQFNQTNAPYWSGSAYTKYNATDGKTTLEASDDVASIILGDTWRMPTTKEFQALKEVTYWAWDATDKGYYVYTPANGDEGGLNGKKADKSTPVTGSYDKADALLFFPAAGNGYTDTYYDAGNLGDFWTGSLNSANPAKGCILYLNGEEGSVDAASNDSDRYRGYSVRPVQDPEAKYEAVTNVSLDVTAKEIEAGGNVQLKVTVAPATATQNGVYWTSSATTVATVDATGKVTGVKAGTAIITATTVDGTKTATCTVTVTAPVTTFKAVYNTNGDANTLTFYYDAVDHSGEGITVYDNLPTAATKASAWGYDSNRVNIKSVVIDASVADYKGLTSTAYMFQNMKAATSISGAEYLNVSNVTDMNQMFLSYGHDSESLADVPNVSNWNTEKVTNMKSMFSGYGFSSKTLADVPNVSNWNTEKVTNMSGMFSTFGHNSGSLAVVPDVKNWNTEEVTNMSYMFQAYGSASTSLNKVPEVGRWNTAKVTTMAEMFREYGASSTVLKAVPDVSGWNTINVTTMANLFQNYGKGSVDFVLDLSGWDLSKITETNGKYVFSFTPKTFDVTIPAKTGAKSNEGDKWYYGDGTNYIAPPEGKTFTILPAGALKGVFSVSATKKVHFSKGNLQATYNSSASTYTWGFAANQYSYIGKAAGNTTIDSQTNGAVVDLFGWSTASTTYGISTSESDENYSGDFVDWGKAIDDKGTWSTLSKDEWQYLINKDDNENIRKGKNKCGVTVCGKANCLILAPDDFEGTIAASYDAAAWATAEAAGLVCLPAAGRRSGSDVDNVGVSAFWSSTARGNAQAYILTFINDIVSPVGYDGRDVGFSVRLVTEGVAGGNSGNGTEQYKNNSNPNWFSSK